jgi:thiol-disulfide isomerase/thioredoxin
MRSKILLTILFPVLICYSYSQEIDKPAHFFNVLSTNGDTVNLQALAGKVVILDFWASWCKPCKEEMPYFIDLYNRNKDIGLVIVAVNLDENQDKLFGFINKLGKEVPFYIIHDKDSKIAGDYKIETMPTSYVIDKKGVIKYKHEGFENSYKEQFENEIKKLSSE